MWLVLWLKWKACDILMKNWTLIGRNDHLGIIFLSLMWPVTTKAPRKYLNKSLLLKNGTAMRKKLDWALQKSPPNSKVTHCQLFIFRFAIMDRKEFGQLASLDWSENCTKQMRSYSLLPYKRTKTDSTQARLTISFRRGHPFSMYTSKGGGGC